MNGIWNRRRKRYALFDEQLRAGRRNMMRFISLVVLCMLILDTSVNMHTMSYSQKSGEVLSPLSTRTMSICAAATDDIVFRALPVSRHILYGKHSYKEYVPRDDMGELPDNPHGTIIAPLTVSSSSNAATQQCSARFIWPIRDAQIVRSFDKPEHNWEPGHRGVDIKAPEGETILAPEDGVISFVGTVAGKAVVSIRHTGKAHNVRNSPLTSTFEPATTDAQIGTRVKSGESLASVSGHSDHCDGGCLHWGLKRSATDYVDPQSYVRPRKIVLLPISH